MPVYPHQGLALAPAHYLTVPPGGPLDSAGTAGDRSWEVGEAGPTTGPTCPPPQVQSELLRCWHRWRVGKALQEECHMGSHTTSARPAGSTPREKLLLSRGGGSNGASQDPSAETHLAGGLPGLAERPF